MLTDAEHLSMLQACGSEAVTVGEDTLQGIYDHEYVETQDVAGEAPVLTVRTVDTTTYSVSRGTSVTVSGTSYTVADVQPDGLGITKLILEET